MLVFEEISLYPNPAADHVTLDFNGKESGDVEIVVFDLLGHKKYVTALAFSTDGNYLASGAVGKEIIIWDLKTGKRISSLQGTKRHEVFSSVRFSPDGKTLITGAASRKVSIYTWVTHLKNIIKFSF